MGTRDIYQEGVLRACIAAGDETAFAEQLGVPVGTVVDWLLGEQPIPAAVFIFAVDLMLFRSVEHVKDVRKFLEEVTQRKERRARPMRRSTLIDDFIARSDSGTRYRVFIWQHWLDREGTVPGPTEGCLSTGEPLSGIDGDTYEIAKTGVRIKRER